MVGGGNTCPRITCVVIDCVCVCFLVTVFGDYVCVLGGGRLFAETKER